MGKILSKMIFTKSYINKNNKFENLLKLIKEKLNILLNSSKKPQNPLK